MSKQKSESKTNVTPHATTNGSSITGVGATVTYSNNSSNVSAPTHFSSAPTFFAVNASKDVYSSGGVKVTVGGSVNNAGSYQGYTAVGYKW